MQDQTVPWKAGEINCYTTSFCLQGILNDTNEQDTYLLNCTRKHMMKSGAPPDRIRVLHHPLPIESMVSQAELVSKGYDYLVMTVWVPLILFNTRKTPWQRCMGILV